MVPVVVVLSPAKTIDMAAVSGQFLCTKPRMQEEASTLLTEMKKKDKGALKKMMSVSDVRRSFLLKFYTCTHARANVHTSSHAASLPFTCGIVRFQVSTPYLFGAGWEESATSAQENLCKRIIGN